VLRGIQFRRGHIKAVTLRRASAAAKWIEVEQIKHAESGTCMCSVK
jgi:hypothetical protein